MGMGIWIISNRDFVNQKTTAWRSSLAGSELRELPCIYTNMARVWFYNIPFHGHVNPTLPLIREMVARGDEVSYFSTAAFEARIQATGALYRAYSSSYSFEQTRKVSHVVHLGSQVAEATYALLPDVLDSVAAESPEYLMFDMSAPWGKIASRQLHIPAVASFPHLPFYWRTVLNDFRVLRKGIQSIRPGYGYWRELRRQTARIIKDYRLRDPKTINVLSSFAELNIVFSSRFFQPYEKHFDDSYLYVGPEIELDRREEPISIQKQEGQKLIYVAVGTVYQANLEFFRACIEAFADPQYLVILSVGRAIEPESLGTTPPNFRVEQYVPQLSVLEQADLFITHGGMNSISESVFYEVPMIVVPNTIEQAINAARVEQLHAGLYLDPSQLTSIGLRQTAEAVIADPAMTTGLQKIRSSFEEAGGVFRAAGAIQAFKKEHRLI
jgi:MGT family glycosyltransferase